MHTSHRRHVSQFWSLTRVTILSCSYRCRAGRSASTSLKSIRAQVAARSTSQPAGGPPLSWPLRRSFQAERSVRFPALAIGPYSQHTKKLYLPLGCSMKQPRDVAYEQAVVCSLVVSFL